MREKEMNTRRTRNSLYDHSETATELSVTTMDPNQLKEGILKALAGLSSEGKSFARDRLLAGLGETGVNVASCFLMMGIPARTSDDVTAPELAMLVRYVRINQPSVLESIEDQLLELLAFSRGESSRTMNRKAA
jgi:hypothetical protein